MEDTCAQDRVVLHPEPSDEPVRGQERRLTRGGLITMDPVPDVDEDGVDDLVYSIPTRCDEPRRPPWRARIAPLEVPAPDLLEPAMVRRRSDRQDDQRPLLPRPP